MLLRRCKLSIPLDKMVDSEKNVYELTCVAIKEASIIANNKKMVEELETKNEKIVSTVLNKVLNNEVEYTRE